MHVGACVCVCVCVFMGSLTEDVCEPLFGSLCMHVCVCVRACDWISSVFIGVCGLILTKPVDVCLTDTESEADWYICPKNTCVHVYCTCTPLCKCVFLLRPCWRETQLPESNESSGSTKSHFIKSVGKGPGR